MNCLDRYFKEHGWPTSTIFQNPPEDDNDRAKLIDTLQVLYPNFRFTTRFDILSLMKLYISVLGIDFCLLIWYNLLDIISLSVLWRVNYAIALFALLLLLVSFRNVLSSFRWFSFLWQCPWHLSVFLFLGLENWEIQRDNQIWNCKITYLYSSLLLFKSLEFCSISNFLLRTNLVFHLAG